LRRFIIRKLFIINIPSSRELSIITCLLLSLSLIACQANPSATPTLTLEPTTYESTKTPTPPVVTLIAPGETDTPTATPIPLGKPGNPLLISFVSEKLDNQAKTNAELIAKQLSTLTGYEIVSELSPSYDWTLKGMQEGQVHMAWLPPLTYLYASQQGYASVALLANNFGVYLYNSQFLANATSGYRSFFDLTRNQSTADAKTSLAQFKDKTPCWADPGSISSYLVPIGLMKLNNINPADGIYLFNQPAIVRALYIKGICDFGATYAGAGDPRTAKAVQQDLPDALDKVPVIWMSDPVIPNLNFSYYPGIPPEMQKKITQALLDFSKSEAGKSALTVANGYEIQDLKVFGDSVYDPLRKIIDATGVDLQTMIGK
jgi:phosphonate transport system substrate-binding protein